MLCSVFVGIARVAYAFGSNRSAQRTRREGTFAPWFPSPHKADVKSEDRLLHQPYTSQPPNGRVYATDRVLIAYFCAITPNDHRWEASLSGWALDPDGQFRFYMSSPLLPRLKRGYVCVLASHGFEPIGEGQDISRMPVKPVGYSVSSRMRFPIGHCPYSYDASTPFRCL